MAIQYYTYIYVVSCKLKDHLNGFRRKEIYLKGWVFYMIVYLSVRIYRKVDH